MRCSIWAVVSSLAGCREPHCPEQDPRPVRGTPADFHGPLRGEGYTVSAVSACSADAWQVIVAGTGVRRLGPGEFDGWLSGLYARLAARGIDNTGWIVAPCDAGDSIAQIFIDDWTRM